MMELTNKDKRHIEEKVRMLSLRMKDEATEYASLCEEYYYEKVLEKVQTQLEAAKQLRENIKNIYNK